MGSVVPMTSERDPSGVTSHGPALGENVLGLNSIVCNNASTGSYAGLGTVDIPETWACPETRFPNCGCTPSACVEDAGGTDVISVCPPDVPVVCVVPSPDAAVVDATVDAVVGGVVDPVAVPVLAGGI